MACFLLGAVETAAIGKMFARKHDYRLDSNQEFLALASANLAAGLGQGFPTSGGMSQSLVNESSGARTPLSGFISSILILGVILFLSSLLRHLPQPVLAAIVVAAVTGLFNIAALRNMWHFSRADVAVAITALLGVLGSGLLMGVLIGAVLSIIPHPTASPPTDLSATAANARGRCSPTRRAHETGADDLSDIHHDTLTAAVGQTPNQPPS